ncbi:MAG: ribose 5-phosphate isomerase B [Firmicutes bacterium]|nr:ribose 5-phosphate isomerase B [[Eubacterium] siraeum]MCM1488079.1 ribose 5-phosphate isomerase B [Bacillota bacterium]
MIVLGSDRAGTELKNHLIDFLKENDYEFVDCGENKDYPIIAEQVCKKIVSGEAEKGVLLCGTGVGISMAANKVKGIRAACCSDYFSAKYTRLHNDANVLCMGGRVIAQGLAKELLNVFLTTEFEGGRHAERVKLITELEEK